MEGLPNGGPSVFSRCKDARRLLELMLSGENSRVFGEHTINTRTSLFKQRHRNPLSGYPLKGYG